MECNNQNDRVMLVMWAKNVILQETCYFQERQDRERQKTGSWKGHGSALSPHYERMADCWAHSGAVISAYLASLPPYLFYTSHSLLSRICFAPSLPLLLILSTASSSLHPALLLSFKAPAFSDPPSFHPSPICPAWFRPLAWEEHQAQWVSAGWA